MPRAAGRRFGSPHSGMDEQREQLKRAAYAQLRELGVPEGAALTEHLARARRRWKAEQEGARRSRLARWIEPAEVAATG